MIIIGGNYHHMIVNQTQHKHWMAHRQFMITPPRRGAAYCNQHVISVTNKADKHAHQIQIQCLLDLTQLNNITTWHLYTQTFITVG